MKYARIIVPTTLSTDREIFMNKPAGATPEVLDAYLRKTCGEDQALRARVEALLEANKGAGSFLTRPALPFLGTAESRRASTDGEGDRAGAGQRL